MGVGVTVGVEVGDGVGVSGTMAIAIPKGTRPTAISSITVMLFVSMTETDPPESGRVTVA